MFARAHRYIIVWESAGPRVTKSTGSRVTEFIGTIIEELFLETIMGEFGVVVIFAFINYCVALSFPMFSWVPWISLEFLSILLCFLDFPRVLSEQSFEFANLSASLIATDLSFKKGRLSNGSF